MLRSMEPDWFSCIGKFVCKLSCPGTIPIGPSIDFIGGPNEFLYLINPQLPLPFRNSNNNNSSNIGLFGSPDRAQSPWPVSPNSMWHQSSHLMSRQEEISAPKHATRLGLLCFALVDRQIYVTNLVVYQF